MISSRKEIGEYSNESILTALRTPGGVADGGRVLIERGRGKKKAKYFTFGAAHGGPVMPEALIKEAPLTILTTVYYMHLHMHYCILYSLLWFSRSLHPTPVSNTLQQIQDNGCFDVTFEHNVHRPWRKVDDIKASLEDFQRTLSEATTGFQAVVKVSLTLAPTLTLTLPTLLPRHPASRRVRPAPARPAPPRRAPRRASPPLAARHRATAPPRA